MHSLLTTGEEEIAQTVLNTRKYRSICPDTVRQIARRELAKRSNVKAALKETKSRLHQIDRAFEGGMEYDVAYRRLEAAFGTGSESVVKAACRKVLRRHSSTRERLPILDRFYAEIWGFTGVPRSLLDLGCGLNPLTMPWMCLPPGAQYFAFDIDATRVAFLNRFFALAGSPPLASWQDIACYPPQVEADVALLLKTSPALERQEKGSTLRLLQALRSTCVVVSFSIKSLGGKEKGMAVHYEREFLATVGSQPWQVNKLRFKTELAFVVRK